MLILPRRPRTCLDLRRPAPVGSVLSGVVVVGGEGLDLGDRQVDGAGGGDSRQSATVAISGGVGGRISDLDRQRRSTTQVSAGAIERDRARTREPVKVSV